MLTLMRHGEASWVSDTDENRRLTEDGIQFVRSQATLYRARFSQLNRIVASPYQRTRQTAELVAETIGLSDIEIVYDERFTPETSIPEAVMALEQYWQPELLVVTHQPLIGELVCYLLNGTILYPEPLLPGQLVAMEMTWPGASQGIRLPS